MWEERLKQYIYENNNLMQDLRIVRSLELPKCYIAAGYIRNYVWDRLHGYEPRAEHDDIDVVYFDVSDRSETRDLRIEQQLIQTTGCTKWSVKNQARMHIRNEAEPYSSIEDALSRWPETATAVAARLNHEDQLEICAPHGLDDLFQLIVRQSPFFEDRQLFAERIRSKRWLEKWPQLKVMEDSDEREVL